MQTLTGGDAQKLALFCRQNDMLDMISLRFDEAKSYEIGDYCLYFNGTFDGLYRFTSAKTTGPWMNGVVEQVSLSDILKEEKKITDSLNSKINKNYGGFLLNLDGVLGRVWTSVAENVDYNTITTPGVAGLYYDSTNGPGFSSFVVNFLVGYNNIINYITQLAIGFGVSKMAIRTRNTANTWTPWVTIL